VDDEIAYPSKEQHRNTENGFKEIFHRKKDSNGLMDLKILILLK